MKTIQLSKDTEANKIGVYQSHNKKIGELFPKDISQAFDWNGEEVINFFLDVLTDCNYHTERETIEEELTKI